MKKFRLVAILLAMLLVISVLFFFVSYRFKGIVENIRPINLKISKAVLFTANIDSDIILENGNINYEKIRLQYPRTKLVLAVGFKVNGSDNIPIGLCINNGFIINRAVADMGLITLSKDGNIFVGHGDMIFGLDNLALLYDGSTIQVQSLKRGRLLAEPENDEIEDHFLLIQDKDGRSSVCSYYGTIKNVIKKLDEKNYFKVLKLGGGTANGGAIFNQDGTTTYVGSTKQSSSLVAVIAFE